MGSSLGDKTFLGRGGSTIVRNTGQNPEMYQWNFSIQRDVGWQPIVEELQARVPNPFCGVITDPQANNYNKDTIQLYRLLRNMPHFDGANGSEPNAADSWYNGLQVKVEKRFSKGLAMLAHYTWSKMMDDVSNGSGNLNWLSNSQGSNLQNPLDFRLEKSLSGNDVAHRFVGTGVYQLPFGQGKALAGT